MLNSMEFEVTVMPFESAAGCRCNGIARRIVIRDMGNGVDRADALDVIPLESARDESKLPGRIPVSIEDDPRLRDWCRDVCSCPGKSCVCCGYLRSLDDNSVELLWWCRC